MDRTGGEVGPQQAQRVGGSEPGGGELVGRPGEQRRRPQRLDAPIVAERLDDAPDVVERGNDGVVGESDVRERRLVAGAADEHLAPWTEPDRRPGSMRADAPSCDPAPDRRQIVAVSSHVAPGHRNEQAAHCEGRVPAASTLRAVAVLWVTHPLYFEHLTGPRHPERPSRLTAVIDAARDQRPRRRAGARRAGAGVARGPRAGPPGRLPRPARTAVGRRWRMDRRRHRREPAVDELRPSSPPVPGSPRFASCGPAVPPPRSARFGRRGTTRPARSRWASASSRTSRSSPLRSPTPANGSGSSTSTRTTATAPRTSSTRTLACSSSARTSGRSIPGTGWRTETGTGAGRGTTMNIPLPAHATGDVYLKAFDEVIAPAVERFAPTLAADLGRLRRPPRRPDHRPRSHRRRLRRAHDAGDVVVPPGRTIAMLEGGYDLDALNASTRAVLGVFAGVDTVVRSGQQRRTGRRGGRRRQCRLGRARSVATSERRVAADRVPRSSRLGTAEG